MYSLCCSTPIGDITLFEENGVLVSLEFGKSGENTKTPFLEKCAAELAEYFSGKRKAFDIKYELSGTEFQKKVWSELIKIPYGQTKSYKSIAKCTGNENAARAVGGACNKNPLPIIVPCHRVVGNNGNLTGFAGGIETKERLLMLEKGERLD